MRRQSQVFNLIEMAMYAAIIILAIQFIKIPMPSAISNSMVHPGNALVALSGLFMGFKRGLIASSLGLFIYDVMNGYGVFGAVETVVQSMIVVLLIEVLYKAMAHRDTKTNIMILGIWASILKIVIRFFVKLVEQLLIGTSFTAAVAVVMSAMPASIFTGIVTIMLVPILYYALKPVFLKYHPIGQ